jgi:hypothetical protein
MGCNINNKPETRQRRKAAKRERQDSTNMVFLIEGVNLRAVLMIVIVPAFPSCQIYTLNRLTICGVY